MMFGGKVHGYEGSKAAGLNKVVSCVRVAGARRKG